LETAVLKVDPANPEPDVIRRAAEILRAGGLVAFPTETVYGLGANALDAAAVARVFEAKGRPATNPLIVHLSDVSEVRNVAGDWPETAAKLAARFWPGPLTLVVPKGENVPDIVTARGPTVAVRCPNHAVARALIRAAGVPLAAPSANRSTELSPTRAGHVLKGLGGRIDLVLDGGPCPGGIESTVVDVTGEVPRLLRPGLVTVPMLEEVCGKVEVYQANRVCEPACSEPSRSPGRMAKHYSPRTPVVLARCTKEAFRFLNEGEAAGLRVLIVGTAAPRDPCPVYRTMPREPEQYAADLYSVLHEVDQAGWDRIVIEMPPDAPEWAAVRDRLTRAATPTEPRP
jgi:L-threonylcarbamoyladenylate synthase